MKSLFYILITVIIAYCLFSTFKTKEKFSTTPNSYQPDPPIIISATYDNGLRIKWTKPPGNQNIVNYIVFIKNYNNVNDNIYLKFTNLSDCLECEYFIDNLNLEPNREYYTSVISVDENGYPSRPANLMRFFISNTSSSTSSSSPSSPNTNSSSSPSSPNTNAPSSSSASPSPTNTNAPSQVLASGVTSTSSPQSSYDNTMTLEDRIKMGEDARKIYLDNELQNMVARANGVYEIDSDQLKYPDVFLSDIKQSINTMNDMVKKDLQEYRINVHLTSQN
jgi:hypothetical protein